MDLPSRRYRYLPLPSNSIRILILEPSLDLQAPIHFSFYSAKLEDIRGKYEAISYTWGEPNLEFPLHHEEGSHVLVTKNLDAALRRLRHRLDRRWLWADAVCINQISLEEKATQIPLMDKIYRGAKRVVAWLGPGGGDDEAGMCVLERLSQWPRDFDKATFEGLDKVGAQVEKFFDLPWFRRLWVIQECVLNVDLTMICGKSEISQARLLTGLQIFKSKGLSKTVSLGQRSMEKTLNLWREYSINLDTNTNTLEKDSSTLDILSMVDRFQDHGCSIAHDRVFALYSMASNITLATQDDTSIGHEDKGLVRMNVDYTLSVQESYSAFAIACMRNKMTVRIIESAVARQQSKKCDGWPSWLPDWREQPRNRAILYSGLLSESTPFVAFTGRVYGNRIQLRVGLDKTDGPTVTDEVAEIHVPSAADLVHVVAKGEIGPGRSINSLLYSTISLFNGEPQATNDIGDHETNMIYNTVQRIWTIDAFDYTSLSEDFKARCSTEWRETYMKWYSDSVEGEFEYYRARVMSDDTLLPPQLVAFMQDRCIFTAADPCSTYKKTILGFGSAALRGGDKLVNVCGGLKESLGRNEFYNSRLDQVYEGYALILRPVEAGSDEESESDTFEIVGDAFICASDWTHVGGMEIWIA